MKIAFLGIGLMGTPMVRNMAAKGYDMQIWNRSIEKAQSLSEIAKVFSSPVDAVENAEFIITMLADGAVTTAVLKDAGVIEAAADNAIIINMGSVEPESDILLARLAAKNRKGFIDAPVSGGVNGAEAATLTIFAGGAEQDIKRASPVLETLGRLNHLGDVGAGQTAKLANQLIVGVTIGAVAEAFKLFAAAGYDIAALQKALGGGFADSRILEIHGQRMVNANYEPGGRSSTQLKDMKNILAQASAKNLCLPLADSARQSYDALVNDHNGAELDHSAYYLWLDYLNGKTAKAHIDA